MAEIILTVEQATALAGTGAPVTVGGPDGRPIGSMDPREAELLAVARERVRRQRENPEPTVPAAKVSAGLVALQVEWDRLGGFDAAYARDFMTRFTTAHD